MVQQQEQIVTLLSKLVQNKSQDQPPAPVTPKQSHPPPIIPQQPHPPSHLSTHHSTAVPCSSCHSTSAPPPPVFSPIAPQQSHAPVTPQQPHPLPSLHPSLRSSPMLLLSLNSTSMFLLSLHSSPVFPPLHRHSLLYRVPSVGKQTYPSSHLIGSHKRTPHLNNQNTTQVILNLQPQAINQSILMMPAVLIMSLILPTSWTLQLMTQTMGRGRTQA